MWKVIKDFEEYQVSTDGEIKSIKGGEEHILKPQKSKNGYYTVRFWKNSKGYTKTIHRLVAEAFIPNHDNKPCVDHINGNRHDNRVENLRWCTYKENSNFEIAKSNYSKMHKGKTLSEEHKEKISKALKGREVPYFEKRIDQYTIDGEFVKTWKSTMEIERNLGFIHNNISTACKGIYKQCYGFKWCYNDD